ncbi:VirK family protein [Pseudochrobactrum sp. HB0163]|uniref:VirK family protein n=1 Tax=Pseudochrobactrum sp. HB0163 TaxID=3450708 RepID=UPI003F6DE7FB
MNNIIKPTLVATLLLVTANYALATPRYDKIIQRLSSGEPLVSILHIGKCKIKSGKTTLKINPTGGNKISDFMILPSPKSYIAYANKHFTIMPDGTPVLEFTQYRVKSNEEATVTVNRLSPVTYKQLSPSMIFACRLGEGIEIKP